MDNDIIYTLIFIALCGFTVIAAISCLALPFLRPYLLWAISSFLLFPFYKPNSAYITLWLFFTIMVHTIIFDEINLRWLWDFIPDRCQMKGCKRQGHRGWENLMDDGMYVCDHCSVRYYLIKQGLIDET